MRTGINILAHGSMIRKRVLVLTFGRRQIDISWIIPLDDDQVTHGYDRTSARTVIRSNEDQQGSWENDQMHGKGRYYFADGRVYRGTMVKDQQTGYGVCRWPSGDRYE